MSIEDNKRIVADFFKYFSAADVPGALELLDDDAIWRVMGREGGLPMSGEMNKEAIGTLMGNVKAAIPDGMTLTSTGWTAEGDRVALEMESYGKMANGNVYNNHYHFLVTVLDGKITSLREYMDTYQVKRLFIDA
ncbi:nuclear transport factor 2 family protein [Adonisia turfae]|uniref:Nuclear transport factor 2 family protein n=1 Tax=Adonisia turfae CCMR0081 TaxID=2292702 RepID=A0A6M0RJJ8_9CYAN|nr:nuclear transport factor 2 family protein [Adonisia turfae]NEZ56386.1 nuclear transport factor 2 family protein [Adonisia turfae CCMR0081]